MKERALNGVYEGRASENYLREKKGYLEVQGL